MHFSRISAPGRLLGCLLWLSPLLSLAGPLDPSAVPDPLKPWLPWVLHDNKTLDCPFLYNRGERQCRWPARLSLEVDQQGARFSQHWQLHGEGWIDLPGGPRHWPQEVTVNGQPAVVTETGEQRPRIYLAAGEYRVEGKFSWERRPESLPVPAISALVSLTLDGETVDLPRLDAQGRLWLHREGGRQTGGEDEENRLELRVYRHILDQIPLRLETWLELDVGGKAREIILGPVINPDNFVPMQLSTRLPARLEPDGRLRLQVRPGSWRVILKVRHKGPAMSLSRPEADDPWPGDEIWVFEAQHSLRLVQIRGGEAVDPQQTGLPENWKKLPAYRLEPGQALEFEQKRRGDPEPAPDRLSLHRDFWLDFDGGGYTVQDHIQGRMTRGWRLEMAAPGQLGRVGVDGEDQFITRLGENGVGVEVRRGDINLEADSRLENHREQLPVVGWRHDFQQVSATLHLPPGWGLWHLSGSDNLPDTWLRPWTVLDLDLFLVLIITLAVGKLWGWRWSVLALPTLLLTWHEPGAPRWVWINILVAVALLRVLPPARWFTRLVTLYRNLALLGLLLLALPFMGQQTRQALFPQLEFPWRQVMSDSTAATFAKRQSFSNWDSGTQVHKMPAMEEMEEMDTAQAGRVLQAPPAPMAQQRLDRVQAGNQWVSRDKQEGGKSKSSKLLQIDPKAQVQTGPGLPHWSWRTVRMEWNGPVKRDSRVRLYLLSPTAERWLGFLRVLLLAGLGLFLLRDAWTRRETKADHAPPGSSATQAATWLIWPLVGLSLLLSPPAQAGGKGGMAAPETADSGGGYPSPALLEELGQRLLAPPDCLPDCAALPRMHLTLRADELRLFMEIHAETATAVPLPGQARQWLPRQVWVNQQPARALLRDGEGRLWIKLPAGIHQVQASGKLPSRNTLQLSLPLLPRQVGVDSEGWRVEGVHENGTADSQLQFTREAAEDQGEAELESGQLPPFVVVERELLLGLEWEVVTTARRLTPGGSAVVLEIPLLPGESVTSELPRVENGKALINLSPGENRVSWSSVFSRRETIHLEAPSTHAWSEVWRLDASAIWHVELEGIPVIHHQDEGRWLPEWRPWPGESVTLQVSRPEGVPGRIMTVDRSTLEIRPGHRATDYHLSFTLRGSRGGQHPIVLPEGAGLLGVKINGQSQPLRQEGREVTLPVTPGTQTFELDFRLDQGISVYFRGPSINLGMDSVNHRIQLHVPKNRWILLAGGPRMGPAVLFWGVLLVVLLLAIGLGRVKLTPLKTWQWFLLLLVVSQLSAPAVIGVAAWLLALGWREQKLEVSGIPPWKFNLLQLLLVGLTLVALAALIKAIEQGLLGHPSMHIGGNGSSRSLLRWYQDRLDSTLPHAWMISLPLLAYRLAMLAWALWLALALLDWLRWGWRCFTAGGGWKPIQWRWRRKAS